MKPFINWLSTPYFFNPDPKHHLVLSFIIGSFIFLFTFTFRPFGMAELENNLFLYCLGFGVITFIVQSFLFVIIPLIFKSFFNNKKWNVGKNILFLLILVSFISIANWYYNSKVQITSNAKLLSFKEIFSYTFSISIFPIFLYMFFSEKHYYSKQEKETEFTEDLQVLDTIKEITIYGNNNNESITFNTENLIYITSQKNYVNFVIKTNNGIKEHILRSTLSSISIKLEKYVVFFKCHKSYIINTTFFDSISGNTKGYFFESKIISKQIPVSRKFNIEELKELIK